MAIKVSAFLTTVCLLFAAEARAVSGNEWRGLPKLAQSSYVAGVVDTWNVLGRAALLAKEQSSAITIFAKLATCATGMEYDQIETVHGYLGINHGFKAGQTCLKSQRANRTILHRFLDKRFLMRSAKR